MIKYLFLIIFPVILNAQEADVPVVDTPNPEPDSEIVSETNPEPVSESDVVNTPPPPPSSESDIVNIPPPAPGSEPDVANTPPTAPSSEPVNPGDTIPTIPVAPTSTTQIAGETSKPPVPEVEIDLSPDVGFGTEGIVLNYKIRQENLDRDPFTRVYQQRTPASTTDRIVTEFLDPKMPLESFPIEKLRLTGILWRTAAPRAVFLDPNGSSYIARKNERIGTNKGYIAAIREGEVVVIEPSMKAGYSYETEILRIENDVKKVEKEEVVATEPPARGRRGFEAELLKTIDTIEKMDK